MNNAENQRCPPRRFYCIYVKTGDESKYIEEIQPVLDSPDMPCNGKLYCLGKKMRLKNGKEYTESIFPGYIFLETEKIDGISFLKKGKSFIRLLPTNDNPRPLCDNDVELINSFLRYGTIIPILKVTFDINDRIQILDGPFQGQEGLVKAVNRRNKRVNFEVELLNGIHVVGLTYEVVKKSGE